MSNLKLYTRFIGIYLKSLMEYRLAFFMDIFVNGFTYLINFLSIWIIVDRFNAIGEWSYYEVLFLFSMNLLSWGICGLFVWAPMVNLQGMVQNGSFDSILTKPLNPFLHMVFRGFQHTFFGHLIVAVAIFIPCLFKLNIVWSFGSIVYFILAILGAILIHASIMIIIASLSFWVVKTNTIMDLIIYNVRNFINYPVSIYSKIIRGLLTFVIPYAFINYIPAKYLLNKTGSYDFGEVVYMLAPAAGILMFSAAYTLWRFGIKQYQSTGS